MALPSINPKETTAWKKLEEHFNEIQNKEDFPGVHLNISWNDFYFDFSKNLMTNQTLEFLVSLAEEVHLKEAVEQQFNGEKINETEGRAVLHTELRNFDTMRSDVKETLDKMRIFSERVINGTHRGYSGKEITDIVNIGIGGSHLGPEMVTEALGFYRNHLNIHFLANIDGDNAYQLLQKLNPETTLFIVVSKSFTTQETLANAELARKVFLNSAPEADISSHFVAVTSNNQKAIEFGIKEENIFPMEDWVGGRFSLWSAVGLSICCGIGYSNFEQLLKGAFEADRHFRNTDLKKNIPVLMALISIWYNNFFQRETETIVAYYESLHKLVPYLQQAVMESNGKSTSRNGQKIDYETGTVVWGNVGTNAQHAFFQLLHQGTKWAPIDFIGFVNPLFKEAQNHHDMLMANFIAQSEALWYGTKGKNITNPHRQFDGNRPSNSILIGKLTPSNLGSLIAFYEHKIFVQGVIWNIFSYDQWGVELGKINAKGILRALKKNDSEICKQKLSEHLISEYFKLKNRKD